MPISSPDQIMGIPGMVAISPSATTTSTSSPSRVRMRSESCELTRFIAWAVARHGTDAATSRIPATIAPPGRRGVSAYSECRSGRSGLSHCHAGIEKPV